MRKNDSRLIRLRGARQNNLKNIDLDLIPGSFTVITGPSGSGKSSLAFDTLYAEGQRRYAETFSPYARQFLDRCDKPDVDEISGIPPAIAINQGATVKTSRSTVGTMTELNDHIKLLFARYGHLICRQCANPVREMSAQDIWGDILARSRSLDNPRLALTFAVFVPASIPIEQAHQSLESQGFSRIHSELTQSEGTILNVVADRFRPLSVPHSRAIESIELALNTGKGRCAGRLDVHVLSDQGDDLQIWKYAKGLTCAECDIEYSHPSSSLFSFNSAVGACETCRGFGRIIGIDLDLIIPDKTLSLSEGAVKPWQGSGVNHTCQVEMMRYAQRDGIRTDVPFSELSTEEKRWVIEGERTWSGKWSQQWYGIRNFFLWLETKAYKLHVRVMLSRFRSYTTCPDCQGSRLKPDALLWHIGRSEAKGAYSRFVPLGQRHLMERVLATPGLNMHELMQQPISELLRFFNTLKSEIPDEPGELILSEICTRLNYLCAVGLGYLCLDRQSRTLSGGEVQRVNLTTALGTNLVDTLFVLDEPSVGLHPRDMDRVNAILGRLRDAGNTLVVVEHDPQVMLRGDRILDMGPGSGTEGGNIVFDGRPDQLSDSQSLTARYLTGRLGVGNGLPRVYPNQFRHWLTLTGAREHNLKSIDLRIPLETMTAITGVSGSGKSTLACDILVPALARALGDHAQQPGRHDDLHGFESLQAVNFVDQSALGKTTRTAPVVYMGAFSAIRNLFAKTEEAQLRGYDAGRFSFNSGEGRCPTCMGCGFQTVEMQFLSDVQLRCPDCNGTRYRPETLEVALALPNGRQVSIADVLNMPVSDALIAFSSYRDITHALKPLEDVGLGYIRLGQPVSTLSGGEAQRLKLAAILAESLKARKPKKTLFVFDEPTTGLHFDDIAKLLRALRKLVAQGHSIVVIEHNLDVIESCDWVVDLGPEGGDEGGNIVVQGTPDSICEFEQSHTGQALRSYRKALESAVPTHDAFFTKSVHLATQPSGRSLQSVWRKAHNTDLGIFGARENNLKNIDTVIPKNSMTVITGPSGSGKSTLAFGIVFAEGQRRYLESLNAYARSIIQPGLKADVERVINIAPTVAIEQRTSRGGCKSTVGTLTEIQHFLRLLYVKLGTQRCPDCGTDISPQSFESILSQVLQAYDEQAICVLSPLVNARKGIYTDIAKWALKKNFEQLRVDGHFVRADKFPKLARYTEHTIELPVAFLTVSRRQENELSEALRNALQYGHGTLRILSGDFSDCAPRTFSTRRACPRCARSFPELDPRLFSYNSKLGWCPQCFGSGQLFADAAFDSEQTGEEAQWRNALSRPCPTCKGTRLNPIARNVYFQGYSIADISATTVSKCLDIFENMTLSGSQKIIGAPALKEILSRLRFLDNVGLGYLTLDRAAPTLSGGEAQRIRLASQLGNNLQGICYVLDEPTIGLHPRDNARLIDNLLQLRDKGNTLVVVEHDEDTIRHADHVIDIGPGAGSLGGKVVAQGSLKEILENQESLTARMLRKTGQNMHRQAVAYTCDDPHLTVQHASVHNLKDLSVQIPLRRLVVITGVSGSGKSTLARDVLLSAWESQIKPTADFSVLGFEQISRILEVDQKPIGKTPRSCPATYVGFFNAIRDLFAQTNEAQEHGYDASRFSFNTAHGRCPICEGQGEVRVEMNFLPDVKVPCEACHGMRFDEETLSVHWQNKSIGDILNLTVDEALDFFSSMSRIRKPLALLHDVGLGYLRLGQPSSTLSGGEAQRIKLVTELAKNERPGKASTPKTLYILDEPTVGLHMADVERLLGVLHRLVAAGNSVLVIEHNLDVIADADHLIDMGPEGGIAGGQVCAIGTPLQVAAQDTPTGVALRTHLRL